jgi:hypothetical protein
LLWIFIKSRNTESKQTITNLWEFQNCFGRSRKTEGDYVVLVTPEMTTLFLDHFSTLHHLQNKIWEKVMKKLTKGTGNR